MSDSACNIKDALLQMCCKDSNSVSKPQHIGSILNVISKHIEKKGYDSIGLDIVDFFTWFYLIVLYILLLINIKSSLFPVYELL
jgi:hypothetical protein